MFINNIHLVPFIYFALFSVSINTLSEDSSISSKMVDILLFQVDLSINAPKFSNGSLFHTLHDFPSFARKVRIDQRNEHSFH